MLFETLLLLGGGMFVIGLLGKPTRPQQPKQHLIHLAHRK